MTKKVLILTLVAAASSVAVYAYIKKQQKAKRKNVPINFI